jgi:hypothetical protein
MTKDESEQTAGQRLIKAAKEASAIARGESAPVAEHYPEYARNHYSTRKQISSDIKQRLRAAEVWEKLIAERQSPNPDHMTELGNEAADAIEALEGEVSDWKKSANTYLAWSEEWRARAERLEGEVARFIRSVQRQTAEFNRTADAAEARAERLLDTLMRLLAVANDHMTSCDRTMGDTHPCTCGADEARKALEDDKQ